MLGVRKKFAMVGEILNSLVNAISVITGDDENYIFEINKNFSPTLEGVTVYRSIQVYRY